MSQHTPEPENNCPRCSGSGETDSGGVTPWETEILIPCECTMKNQNKHTPEPWPEPSFNSGIDARDDRYEIIDHNESVVIGDFFTYEDANRAVTCVNACAGMADPVEEVKRMRQALMKLAKEDCYYIESQGGTCLSRKHWVADNYCTICLAKHALATLGGAK